jgi:hypothetical protein
VDSFPLVGKWIVWRIGNGRKICIGEEPWVRADEDYKLSKEVRKFLARKFVFSLWDSRVLDLVHMGRSRWKTKNELGLIGYQSKE